MESSAEWVIHTEGLSKSYKNVHALKSLVLDNTSIAAQNRIASQPWVSDLSVTEKDGHFTWQVAVTENEAATSELLRLVLSDRSINVLKFGQKKLDLEEVFLMGWSIQSHGKGFGVM